MFLLDVQGSEAVFGKECVGNPCCGTILKHSEGPSLKFSDYKRLCLKWEQAVVAALRTALMSREYVQTRNALLFLSYNSKVSILPCRLLILKAHVVYASVPALLQINLPFGL